jgi:hypothetical protein
MRPPRARFWNATKRTGGHNRVAERNGQRPHGVPREDAPTLASSSLRRSVHSSLSPSVALLLVQRLAWARRAGRCRRVDTASPAMSKRGASEAARAAEVERRRLAIPMIRRVPGADIDRVMPWQFEKQGRLASAPSGRCVPSVDSRALGCVFLRVICSDRNARRVTAERADREI